MSEWVPKRRFFTFKPNLFSGRFFFYFGDWTDMPAVAEWYCSYGLTDKRDLFARNVNEFSLTEAWTCQPHDCHPIGIFKDLPTTPHHLGNLTHEIHHMVQRWTASLGIYTGDESEEVFAYVEGKLVEAVLEYLWHGNVMEGLTTDDRHNAVP
jgi:hypothetical protein